MLKKKNPDWVLKHKEKNREIRFLNKTYYLYEMKSIWDENKKRSKKVTGTYLGKITEEGLIEPKHKRVLSSLKNITIKEYGASSLLNILEKDLKIKLEKYFPKDWEEIFLFAVFRFFESSPIKTMNHHFIHSYFSEMFPINLKKLDLIGGK